MLLNRVVFLAIVSAILLGASSARAEAGTGCLVLSSASPRITASWMVEDESSREPALANAPGESPMSSTLNKVVRFRVEVVSPESPLSALAFGVSKGSGMLSFTSADIFLMLPNITSGSGTLEDSSFGWMKVKKDVHQDLRLHLFATTEGGFVVEFSRPAKAPAGEAAAEDVDLAMGSKQGIVWAYWEGPAGHKGRRPTDMGSVSGPVDWSAPSGDDRCSKATEERRELAALAVASSSSSSNACGGLLAKSSVSYGSRFFVSWETTPDGKSITITMTGHTTGWISWGFNSAYRMKGSDYYTGWVSKSGTVTLLDTYSDGHSTPSTDTSLGGKDDTRNVTGSQNSTHTTITFTRLLNTGDKYDTVLDPTKRSVMTMWGLSPSDGTSPSKYPEHSAYGGGSLDIFVCNGGENIGGIYNTLSIGALNNAGQALAASIAIGLLICGVVRVAHSQLFRVRGVWPSSKPAELELSPSACSGPAAAAAPPASVSSETNSEDSEVYKQADTADAAKLPEPQSSSPRASGAATEGARTGGPITFASGVVEARAFGLNPVWTILLAIAFVALNALWAIVWLVKGYSINSLDTAGKEEAAARVAGQLAGANMLIAVLPATRNSLLALTAGLPFERAIPLHRWAGRFAVLMIIVHAVLFSLARNSDVLPWSNDSGSYSVVGSQLAAWLALICAVIVAITASGFIRRKAFNVFLSFHLLVIPLFILATAHNDGVAPYLVAAAVIWGADRVLRLVRAAGQTGRAAEVVPLPDGVVRVRWPKSSLAAALSAAGVYAPGQYAFLSISPAGPTVSSPGLRLLKNVMTEPSHPFSLTSSSRGPLCEVNIRGLGNFTKKLVGTLSEHQQLQRNVAGAEAFVSVDGPYGRLALDLQSYTNVVLVCSGIGITPLVSVLREVYDYSGGSWASSEQGAEAAAAAAVANRRYPRLRSVTLHWGVSNPSQYAWFKDEIERVKKASQQDPSLPTAIFSIHTTCKDPEAQVAPFCPGRIDPEAVVDEALARAAGPTAVIACGIQDMVEKLWDLCAKKRRAGYEIGFHYESFLF